jgi:hypothetical protein
MTDNNEPDWGGACPTHEANADAILADGSRYLSPVQAAEQDRLVVAYRETIARLMNERDTWRTQAVESAHWIGSILGALDLREDATPEDALNVARQARSAEQDAPEPPACGHILADPERLASLEHLQWMAWASSILDSEPISDERRARWKALFVPYDELPEDMKEEDRKWARAVLAMGWDHEPVVDAAPPAAPTSEVMYLTDAVGWQGPPAAPTTTREHLTTCKKYGVGLGGGSRRGYPCTCGLDAALADRGQEEPRDG